MSEAKIYHGDCLEVLATLPDCSVNCCVTSPPYYGLRDYGVDGQIGLEVTPDEYIANLVEVFRECKRILRDDGTLWVNIGDSYAANGEKQTGRNDENPVDIQRRFEKYGTGRPKALTGLNERNKVKVETGLKPKDLIGIPWMLAFALRADGWYLRQDIIWAKPNPMPEGVKDRCTKSHEYIFLLSKSAKYYYDNEAVKDPVENMGKPRAFSKPGNGDRNDVGRIYEPQSTRNRRSVWTVATKPFKGAHFAVFPPGLIRPCVLAGCPAGGVVLDPFSGAGTTGVVAIQEGRNYIGIELNPEYVEMSRKRIEAEQSQGKLAI